MKSKINYLIVMGDSLSDRGTLAKRHGLGLIPMKTFSGLEAKKSPFGRFTNGYNWIDTIAERLHKFYSQNEPTYVEERHTPHYTLNDDKKVMFQDDFLLRSYAEGGLTSHNYGNAPAWPGAVNEELARLMVSNLSEKRSLLLEDDIKHKLNSEHKSHTLVLEWSGANDLITVNSEPNKTAIDYSIASRVRNLKELIKNGYRNFALFNLPDLSLTPYYHSKSKTLRDDAKTMSALYNQKLSEALLSVQREFQHSCQIEMFDVSDHFTTIYTNPSDYGFDNSKMQKYYTQSRALCSKDYDGSSADYMFWDEIHPSEDMHTKLADHALEFIHEKFELLSPTNESGKNNTHIQLLKDFSYKFDIYNQKNNEAWFGIYSFFSYPTLTIDTKLSASENLEHIIYHTFTLKTDYVLDIFKDLGWIDSKLRFSGATPVEIIQIEEQRQEPLKAISNL